MHVSEDRNHVVVVQRQGQGADIAGGLRVVLDLFERLNDPKTAVFLDSVLDFDDILTVLLVVCLGSITGNGIGPVPGGLVDALAFVSLQIKGFKAGISLTCGLVDKLRRFHLDAHFVC